MINIGNKVQTGQISILPCGQVTGNMEYTSGGLSVIIIN